MINIKIMNRDPVATDAGYMQLQKWYNSTNQTTWTYYTNDSGDVWILDGSYWKQVLGTPLRNANNKFTLTDTGNAAKFDLLYSRLAVVKWKESGVVKMAMIVSATYTTNVVTCTIIGDTMTSIDANTLKYSITSPNIISFAYAGTIAVGTDIMGKFISSDNYRIFGACAYHSTSGTTNATTYDIKKNGVSVFTTKLSVGSGAVNGVITSVNNGSSLVVNDIISVDCVSVSTTKPIDCYIYLYVFPTYNYLLD